MHDVGGLACSRRHSVRSARAFSLCLPHRRPRARRVIVLTACCANLPKVIRPFLIHAGRAALFGVLLVASASRARAQLPVMAERAQEGATKAAWITFGAMLISLIAAIAGAMWGRRRVVETLAHSNVTSELAQERTTSMR